MIIAFFGLIAGLLVAFFSRFTYFDLWSFSSFSSEKIGHWMFTTSVIVLLSDKWLTAGINAFIYVFTTFYTTGIYKYIRFAFSDYYQQDSIISNMAGGVLYSALPALVCVFLGIVLWNGRKDNLVGKVLLLLPLIIILFEAVFMFYNVFTQQRFLFQSLIDTACSALYIFVFRKHLLPQKHRN